MSMSILTKNQKKTFRKDLKNGDVFIAVVRFDDECGNGHNTFSMTANLYDRGFIRGEAHVTNVNGQKRYLGSCGCLHEEIAQHFPQLVKYLKWHLCSTDGPMHYVANTVYHADDRDHRGLRAGEKKQLVNGRSKLPVWQLIVRDKNGNELKTGSGNWIESIDKPDNNSIANWEPVWIVGEGKAVELEAARHSAIWPEANIEQLRDENQLRQRLPALLAEFRADVESLGFIW